jgi:enolase-phosphatase E1
VTVPLADQGLRVVLLDIEGTTTPLAFVHDVLFPFARAAMPAWCRDFGQSSEFAEVARQLAAEHPTDQAAGQSPPRWRGDSGADLAESVQAYAVWLMDRDRKSPGLKLLQGYIWEQGYQAGLLRGQVYGDVPAAMRRWHAEGVRVAIYSSGSELAQRRLFASTDSGDLTPLVDGFFDTAVGPKGDPESYVRIAGALGCATSGMLLVSDATMELRAAKEAGCRTALSVRPGNRAQPDWEQFVSVRSFDEIG